MIVTLLQHFLRPTILLLGKMRGKRIKIKSPDSGITAAIGL